ncbi:MAG: phosphonate ABC transporter, permease protein PhnE [Nevskiales bacterium]|nr:phosphonate ABC transporter, permease protein PhnE [Nevskiales bacterium]
MSASDSVVAARPPQQWALRPWLRTRTLLLLLLLAALALVSARRTEIDRMFALSAEAVAVGVGGEGHSQVLDGLARIVGHLWPLQLSETRPVSRIENFDRAQLPWGSHLEVERRREQHLDPDTLQMTETTVEREVLVEPYGYLLHVLWLMVETLEIAAWGTLIAIVLAAPLAVLGARGYSPNRAVYALTRGISSLLRAIPDLVSALFLVLAFGFGPIAGVLALGLHTAGFLGKFFAEDVENAPRGPQDALRAAGAGRLELLRYAVLPQVLPSYIGYIQYILERNIRTATVIGIVGAGGIGQELKGRFEMFDFQHVGTILVVIFLTVVALELITGRMRARLI